MAQINWGIVVSIVSLAITIFTIVYSNAKNSEHTNSRIDVIETKLEHNNNEIAELKAEVHKNNQLKERMFKIEGRADVLEEKQDVANHRIADCEDDIKKINDRATRRNAV